MSEAIAWTRWQAPDMSGAMGHQVLPDPPSVITDQALEAIREAARREGFVKGLREGQAAAQAELRRQVSQWQSLMAQLSRPLDVMETELTDSVVALVQTVVATVLRTEVVLDPQPLHNLVRVAFRALPQHDRVWTVTAHPDDAALLSDALEGAPVAWQIQRDASITRGGCRLSSGDAHVDLTLEQRLHEALAQAFPASEK